MLMTCIACIASLIESMLIACIASHSMHVIASIAMGSILTPFIGTPPGPPRAPGGGNFRGREIPGTPRGARAPRPPGARGPKWAVPGLYILFFLLLRGVSGGCTFGPPGTPRGAKKCTFFWVFNNSPSRDKILGQFLGPPRDTQSGAPARGTPMDPQIGPMVGSPSWGWEGLPSHTHPSGDPSPR